MENERNHQCRKCGGIGTPSKALVNYHFIDKSYLRGEKEFVDKLVDCIKCQSCGHSWIPELSTREQAGKWFANKSYLEQHRLTDKYFESRNPSLLTINQVEEIWLKETQVAYCKKITCANPECKTGCKELKFKEKSNQKQFKKFDESLFQAYISKFSYTDKCIALKILKEALSKDESNM